MPAFTVRVPLPSSIQRCLPAAPKKARSAQRSLNANITCRKCRTPFLSFAFSHLQADREGERQQSRLSLFLAFRSIRSSFVCCSLDEPGDFDRVREQNDVTGRDRDRFRFHLLCLSFFKLR